MSADDRKNPNEVTEREIQLPVEDLQSPPVDPAKADEVKGGGDIHVTKPIDVSK